MCPCPALLCWVLTVCQAYAGQWDLTMKGRVSVLKKLILLWGDIHQKNKQTLYPKTIAIVRTGIFKEARERSPGHWGSEGRLYGRGSMWTQIGQWVGVSRLSEQQGQIKQGSGAYLEDEKERAGICLYLFPAPCFSRHLVSIVILVL